MTSYLKAFSQELPSGRPQIDMAPFHKGWGDSEGIPPPQKILAFLGAFSAIFSR